MILPRLLSPRTKDRKLIQSISEAFNSNARMRVISKKRGDALKRDILAIVAYAYMAVKKLGGVIRSQKGNSFLLYYQESGFYLSFADKLRYLCVALLVVGIDRVKGAYQREQSVKKVRKRGVARFQDTDFLYIWFLAQDKSQKDIRGLLEVKQKIIERSRKLQLPIYMETTEERLVNIYQHIGFKFYHCLEEEGSNFKLWFGRYQPAA